jgi:Phage tail tube protein
MPLATGSKSALYIKEESTYGTPPSGNYETMTFNSENLQETINTIVSNEVKANRTVGSVRGGNIMSGGDLNIDFYSKKLGLLFKHLLGAVATTTVTPAALAVGAVVRGNYYTSGGQLYLCHNDGTLVTASPALTVTSKQLQTLDGVTFGHVGAAATVIKQHIFSGSTSLPTGGLTIEKLIAGGTANRYFPTVGNRINTLNLTVPQEGIVTLALGVLGYRFNDSSATSIAGTPTEVADDPYTGFETEIRINSAVNTVVQSAGISISNNLDSNAFVVGQRFRKDIPLGRREVNGNATLFFEDVTMYTLFKQETSVPVCMSFVHDGMYCQIDMPEVKFTGGSPTPAIAGNGTITQQFNFNAFNDSGSYDIQIMLRNDVASF